MSQEDHFNKGGHGFAPDDENRQRQADGGWRPFNADGAPAAGTTPPADDVLPPLQVLKDPYDSMADRHEAAQSHMSTQADRIDDAGVGAAQGLSGAQAVVIDNSAADQFSGGVTPESRMAGLDFTSQNEPLASTTGHSAAGVGDPSTSSPMPEASSNVNETSFGSQHVYGPQSGPQPSVPLGGGMSTGATQDTFGTGPTGFEQGPSDLGFEQNQGGFNVSGGTSAPGSDVLPPQAANPLAMGMDPFNSEADRHDMSMSAMSNKGEQFDTFGVRKSSEFSNMNAVAVDTSAADRFSGGPSGDEKISGLGFSAKSEELGSTTGGSESHAPSSQQMHQPGPQGAGAGNVGTVDFAQQGGFEGTEEKKESFANTAGAGLQSANKQTSAWSMTEGMSSPGQAQDDHIKHAHVSKKIQENIDQAKEAYTQAKSDYAAAEQSALETLEDSRWSSEGPSAAAFSDGSERAEGFKQGMETGIDGLDAAGVSDSRDFGFMSSSEREAAGDAAGRVGVRRAKGGKSTEGKASAGEVSGHTATYEGRGVAAASGVAAVESATAAPANVRSAARKVVVEKQKVKKASDELVAAHQEAAEFITSAERQAAVAQNFVSAGKSALVNAAVNSIGDDSAGGKMVRGSVRGGMNTVRAIKAHHGKGSKATAIAGAVLSGYADEDEDSNINSAIGAVRSAKDIKNTVKRVQTSREKAKKVANVSEKVSSKGFQTAAEKKAADAVSGNAQKSAMKNLMQRRSMNIAQKIKATFGGESRATLAQKLSNSASKIGAKIAKAISTIIEKIVSAIASLLSSAGLVIVAVLAIVILVGLFVVLISGGGEKKKVEGLNEVETQVAEFFQEKGLPDLQIAAIMGNMYAESGMKTGADEGGGEGANGLGLCQWTGGRHTNLVNYAKSVGKPWTDVNVQLDFFWDHDIWGSWGGNNYAVGITYDEKTGRKLILYQCVGDNSEDPTPGTHVGGSKDKFMSTSDLKEAVREFTYGWEVAGNPRLKVRYEAAERYYDALQNGGDSGGDGDHGGGSGAPQISGATARQQAVVNACYSTPSPGLNWCAAWVTNVFKNAGVGYYGGNACDMYNAWCRSADRSQLKVGMIVADSSHYGTGSPGLLYGHVGVYVGNNTVMSNEGTITKKSLQNFIAFYGTGSGVKWGWIGGIDLSK